MYLLLSVAVLFVFLYLFTTVYCFVDVNAFFHFGGAEKSRTVPRLLQTDDSGIYWATTATTLTFNCLFGFLFVF